MPQRTHPLSTPNSRSAEDRIARTSLWLVGAYLVATTVPLVALLRDRGESLPLALHVVELAVIAVSLLPIAPRLMRFWSPLLLGPWLYIELRWIIQGAGRPHADAFVAGWDARLFTNLPLHLTAGPGDSLFASELLHLCY